jgi:hypothetical protein
VAEDTVEKQEAGNATEFSSQIEQLLEKLVPPSEVKITTINGVEIVLPGAIPARRQIKVFRLMRELLEMDEVQAVMQTEASAAGIVDVMVGLTTDESVCEKLAEIFGEAYPGSIPNDENGDAVHPLDALPLEDLVTAIVPFTERFVKKLGKGILVLTKVAS